MPSMFIVEEIELDDTRRGGRGEQEIDVDAAIRFKTREVGGFIAEDEARACQKAAETLDRPGKFIVRMAGYHKIGLGDAASESVGDLEQAIKAERRKRADENARRR